MLAATFGLGEPVLQDDEIVAISGGGRVTPEDYLKPARLLGTLQTLAKPFSGDELLGAVAQALAEEPG